MGADFVECGKCVYGSVTFGPWSQRLFCLLGGCCVAWGVGFACLVDIEH